MAIPIPSTAYVLTSHKTPDRQHRAVEYFPRVFDREDVEIIFYEATYGDKEIPILQKNTWNKSRDSNYNKACMVSMCRICLDIIHRGLQSAYVFEDDAICKKNLHKKASGFCAETPDDCDKLALFRHPLYKPKQKGDRVVRYEKMWGAYGMILTKSFCAKYVKHCWDFPAPDGASFFGHKPYNFKCYISPEELAYCPSMNYSNIQGGIR